VSARLPSGELDLEIRSTLEASGAPEPASLRAILHELRIDRFRSLAIPFVPRLMPYAALALVRCGGRSCR